MRTPAKCFKITMLLIRIYVVVKSRNSDTRYDELIDELERAKVNSKKTTSDYRSLKYIRRIVLLL